MLGSRAEFSNVIVKGPVTGARGRLCHVCFGASCAEPVSIDWALPILRFRALCRAR